MPDGNDTPPTTTPPADPPPQFHIWFAVIAGLVLIGVVVALIWILKLFEVHIGLSDTEWKELEPKGQFAARIAIPITVLGLVSVLLGIWMAVTEWRGRFKFVEKPPKDEKKDGRETLTAPTVDVPKVLEAVGKLRGAALVMIVGAILMVSAAWIASSAAGSDPAPASQTNTTPKQPADK